MFAYSSIDQYDVSSLAKSLMVSGSCAHNPTDWTARTDDFEFITNADALELCDFLRNLSQFQIVEINLTFQVLLYDITCVINLDFYLPESVVGLSARDEFLWLGASDPGRIARQRLNAFVALCEVICNVKMPARGMIGSETCHASEIELSHDTDKFNFDFQAFFSESSISNLARWYDEVYSRRWDDSKESNRRSGA